ncbi:hypothetical protein SLA2020_466810 [Shorea laevis]
MLGSTNEIKESRMCDGDVAYVPTDALPHSAVQVAWSSLVLCSTAAVLAVLLSLSTSLEIGMVLIQVFDFFLRT